MTSEEIVKILESGVKSSMSDGYGDRYIILRAIVDSIIRANKPKEENTNR